MIVRYQYCDKCESWVEKDTCACVPEKDRKQPTQLKPKEDDRRYGCGNCGKVLHISEMGDSMACECGGGFRLLNELVLMGEFKPYHSLELGAFVTSRKHEKRLLAEKGYSFIHDHYKMKKDAAYIRKHKEEFKKDQFAKDGLPYKPNSNTRFDITLKRFVDRTTGKVAYIFAFLILSCLGVCEAKIDMVDYMSIEVGGKVYQIPKANKDYEQEVYWVKKALKGDKEALETLLGTNEEKAIFIGDEYPRWLIIKKDGSYRVEEYPN